MCSVLLIQIGTAGSAVSHMQGDEDMIRHSGELATAIREEYVHLAHLIIEADGSHVHHQAEWSGRVAELVNWLREHGPAGQSESLDHIERNSQRVAVLLRTEIIPGLGEDRARLVAAHREIELLVSEASDLADDVAGEIGSRMIGAHVDANRATRTGFAAGLICVAMILFLSGFFIVRLRTSVIAPLAALAHAAGELGAGNFDIRLGRVGHGELQAVASAFDQMVGELADRERKLRLTERMAAIGQLAAGVAHELNNPIGIIRGYLKTIDLEGDPAEVRAELAIIDEEARACQQFADDLLAYSSTPALQLRVTRMEELIPETVDRLVNAGFSQGHPISCNAEPAEISVDAMRVRQVLSNLVRNAVQASPEGASVQVDGRLAGGAYEVKVSDRGCGVAAEDAERIFEPFFSRRGGSGLGLAVVHGLVVSHGGRILVQPREEGGSVFVVQLPLGRANVAAASGPHDLQEDR